jgi:hypothetical protein
MDACVQDIQLRHAAFEAVSRAAILNGGVLSSDDLAAGFQYQGDPLINP